MSTKFAKLSRLIARFIQTESASSFILAACTIIALFLANGPAATTYQHVLDFRIAGLSLHHWINDGLMAIFFFVVGMEIKREIVAGHLSTWNKAALPVAAAVGGMIVPAVIYYAFNYDGASVRGWAIPMATDIAFALGVLLLLGKRVPLSLKIFLLALAIVDDLGAVLVIAVFYTEKIRLAGLGVSAAGLFGIWLAQRRGIASLLLYLPVAVAVWFGMLYSGVHATIAGVALGLLTPYRFKKRNTAREYSPLDHLVEALHPWVSFAIMPVFALANAGLDISGVEAAAVLGAPVTLGVFFGLLFGKPAGIMAACAIVVGCGFAKRPDDLKWSHLFGVSVLAGIGFTMSIFITNLSLPPAQAVDAKIAIMSASLVAAVLGFGILKILTGVPIIRRKRGT